MYVYMYILSGSKESGRNERKRARRRDPVEEKRKNVEAREEAGEETATAM